MDYSNLKNKTIFDFCTDVDVLYFITKQKSPSRLEYIKLKGADDRLLDLKMLAYITNNDDLGAAIYPLSPGLVEWDNEVIDFAEEYREKHGLQDD